MVEMVRRSARVQRGEDVGIRAVQGRDQIAVAGRTVRAHLHAKDVDGEFVIAGLQLDGSIGRVAEDTGDVDRIAGRERRPRKIGSRQGVRWIDDDGQLDADGLAELRKRRTDGRILGTAAKRIGNRQLCATRRQRTEGEYCYGDRPE
mgnify:CR=1 FL=1